MTKKAKKRIKKTCDNCAENGTSSFDKPCAERKRCCYFKDYWKAAK